MAEVHASISAEPLDVTEALAFVSSPACGGSALFVGTVRVSAAVPGHEHDAVTQLDYEAHPDLADARLQEIGEEAGERWQVERAFAVHRTGTCEVGEPTVVVACSAPHRKDALEACRWMIDEIKRSVPIWKREVYAAGSAWVSEGTAT